MKKIKENELYKIIINNSWNLKIKNYLEFIYNEAGTIEKDKEKITILVENVLRKILNNLKTKIPIEKYEIMINNIGDIGTLYAYDLAIQIIKLYYENEFIINNTKYTVLDIIENKLKSNHEEEKSEMTSEILNCLISLHYILYIKQIKINCHSKNKLL